MAFVKPDNHISAGPYPQGVVPSHQHHGSHRHGGRRGMDILEDSRHRKPSGLLAHGVGPAQGFCRRFVDDNFVGLIEQAISCQQTDAIEIHEISVAVYEQHFYRFTVSRFPFPLRQPYGRTSVIGQQGIHVLLHLVNIRQLAQVVNDLRIAEEGRSFAVALEPDVRMLQVMQLQEQDGQGEQHHQSEKELDADAPLMDADAPSAQTGIALQHRHQRPAGVTGNEDSRQQQRHDKYQHKITCRRYHHSLCNL